MHNSSPFQTLTTDRLILRDLRTDDVADLIILRSDKRVNKYLDRPKTITDNDAKAFIKKIHAGINKKEWFYWAISLRNSDKLIGTICLWHIDKDNDSAEIGYEMHPDFQGKGLMYEAIATIIDFGFILLKLKKIIAFVNPANKRSVRLLEKHNFNRDKGIDDYTGAQKEIGLSLITSD
ncbi:MAG: [ribosomal protein S5]-alanine N-acetyltransferase [Mucilaginibacter sp.]|nr:[ribosomal protein S5]-alanine N-acetyltransferase [Mucilaginibacter sp.]